MAAAAVVLALAAGVGVVAAGTGGHHPSAVAGGRQLRTVGLISATGQVVGTVSAYAGSPAWFFMRVEHGVPSGTYQCVLGVDGGTNIPIGTLTVADSTGAWGQPLAIDARHIRSARLETPNGTTVAAATFP